MSENDYEVPENSAAPVPDEVYYRRRIVAAFIAIFVILLMTWGFVWIFDKFGGSSENTAASAPSTSSSSEPLGSFSARPTASASDHASEKPSASASESASPEASASAEPSASAEHTPEATPTPTPSETPATPQACSATNMNVVLTVSQPSYTAGQQPSVALTYTNTSGNPCDIPAEAQHAVINITSGAAQVYNTATCNASPATVAELAAGQVGKAAFTWDRKLNALGCNNLRDVQPGYYWATATVNGVTSQPVRIIISG